MNKAGITVGGLEKMLLPLTTNISKEILPIFSCCNSKIYMKFTLQFIYVKLYETGLKSFLFIIGVGKGVTEDYFTFLYIYVRINKDTLEYMRIFYQKIFRIKLL